MLMSDVDIVMVGHFAKDRLVVDGRGEMASGGGVYYGGIALCRIGVRVAVVTRLHPDDMGRLDDLRREGILVYAAASEQTSGIENIYRSEDMERRVCRPLGFAGPIQRDGFPPLSCRVYVIASIMAGEVSLPLLQWMADRGPIALDVQGFVRIRMNGDLVYRPWSDMVEGLACVTYLKADRAEAELLTGCEDLRDAARQLSTYGPKEVVLTESSGVTVYADGRFHEAPFTPRSLAGRTGRGDTCFALYVGKRLSVSAAEACRFAAAATTLKQEKPGPWRGTEADVEALLAGRLRPAQGSSGC
jgi:sugar/nucleoside kinase (ribokinase family)